jgi:prepilin-type processing-associated H-X9-DG protein
MKLHPSRRSAGKCLTDLLVVAALTPLATAAFIGCYRGHSREPSARVKCAANLKSIGQALLLYSNENKGAFPRTRYVGGPTVIPTWGTGAPSAQPFPDNGPLPNDVTAALYLLLTTQDIIPEVFVCPSTNADRWDFGGGANTAANWSNWNGLDGIRRNLSYSLQNPYPDDAAVEAGFKWNSGVGAEFAIASDMNPGTAGANENVLAVNASSSAAAMKQGNSPNHDGDGQNILFGDGHVSFENIPFSAIDKDNIFARRVGGKYNVASSRVVDSPLDATDNVLLPTND